MQSSPERVVVTCAPGCAVFLAAELADLGLAVEEKPDPTLTALTVQADRVTQMRLNLQLRTAHRVLREVHRFASDSPDDLYEEIHNVPWEDLLSVDEYLSITSTVSHPTARDSRFPTLRCKDAIVDRMSKRRGRRPDTGNERTGAVVHLHWHNKQASVSIDTSGQPLSRRGYRISPWKAPMQETLAAACVLATGWRGETPFLNPMCGSGTLAIEAALLALNRAPGSLRESFGFMHVPGYDRTAWRDLVADARRRERSSIPAPIHATDSDAGALRSAAINAKSAHVEGAITLARCDFRESPVPPAPGIVILNPEYGERLGDEASLEPLYKAIGDFFKQRCQGYKGYVFTGNMPLSRKIGLRSSRRLTLFNSQIECRLIEFEMYAGTRNPGDGAKEKGGGA